MEIHIRLHEKNLQMNWITHSFAVSKLSEPSRPRQPSEVLVPHAVLSFWAVELLFK